MWFYGDCYSGFYGDFVVIYGDFMVNLLGFNCDLWWFIGISWDLAS